MKSNFVEYNKFSIEAIPISKIQVEFLRKDVLFLITEKIEYQNDFMQIWIIILTIFFLRNSKILFTFKLNTFDEYNTKIDKAI